MAARRLLIIMFLLLGISTLAAALVPPPQEQEETSTSSTRSSTQATTERRPAGSELVRAEVAIGRSGDRPSEVEVEVEPGDQLALVVTSGEPGEVSVPDFGLIEFAGPGNTASFDILVEDRGRFPVRFHGRGTVATIVAERAERKPAQS